MENSKNHSLKIISLLLFLVIPLTIVAQQTLTLDECFEMVTKNYPLVKQSDLLQDKSNLDIEAINKGKLPKLDINAQATYQSDVTSLPIQIPNATVEPPNNDQYRATLDISQSIYNGGLIDASAKVKEATTKVDQQQVEINLYGLKNKVNQLYLSVLLLQENKALLGAKEKQLQTRINEVKAAVKYGTLLPSAANALEVELLKIKQNYSELDYSKSNLIQRLSLLIGRELNIDVTLQQTKVFITPPKEADRPELLLFELQKEQINFSTELLTKTNSPKISGFAQGGYGNPGLNMLDNSFKTYYMTGLRLNWNIFDWNKTKTEKLSLQINKEIINTQKETFELNNNLELIELQTEIDKFQELIVFDEAIISLRENMVKTAESQLKNGVITSSAFISEFTDLFEAKSNLNLHKTQLLLNQIQYQITKGTYRKN
ncbi:MAG: TolC family protein [Maribacter sp.]